MISLAPTFRRLADQRRFDFARSRRSISVVLALVCASACLWLQSQHAAAAERPNILFAIADDWSYPFASAYGYKAISTPAFDRVARDGVLFNNAFAASPGCSPCRAALLTGRHTWQIEEAGTHASGFPTKYVVYPDLLEAAGYHVGVTGKGWGPGNFKASGRTRNPAGKEYSRAATKPPYKGIKGNDYAANFEQFLKQKHADQPFCFWYGCSEPHRAFEQGSGLSAGKRIEDVVVPPFLPDTPEIRSDILDYCVEIEWFDHHLGRMLDALEAAGELDNTLVIVTSDNGMPFPRAKANCYEYGIHMPLAICWKSRAPGARTVDDVVGFVDLTATMLDAAGVEHAGGDYPPAGRSILNILTSDKSGVVDPARTAVFSARERHSSSRWNNLTYPQRSMRTHDYLFVRNFRPNRWPAGDPQALGEDGRPGAMHGAYHDIDGSPSLTYLVEHRDDPKIAPFLDLAVAKRPAVELFDIKNDPACLKNLAADPAYASVRQEMAAQLESYLRETGDARVLDGGDVWETYRRYSGIRNFPKPERLSDEELKAY